jgi:inosine-uridine nucleoside N-ribohydrolase
VGDATMVLRRALARTPAVPTVVFVAIGHATNLLALLRSPPDSVSAQTGYQLVAQRVARLVWMGGSYWVHKRVEWNFGAVRRRTHARAARGGA